jgi:hypothetical protein
MSFRNRLLPRERRRQPKVETNERSSARDHSRRLRSLPHTFDYRSIVNGVDRFVDWVDHGIIASLGTLENLLGSEPSPTLQGSTSQASNNNAVETPIDTNPQRPCSTTTEESTQDSFRILDYMERFIDWIDVGITGVLNTCVELEHDFQGSTSQVSNHSVVEIPTATNLQKPCMTTVEESQETVTPTLEMAVEISPEIYESFVSETPTLETPVEISSEIHESFVSETPTLETPVEFSIEIYESILSETPTLETPVEISPEIHESFVSETPTLETPMEISSENHESFVSETYESCFVEHTDVADSTIAEEVFGEAPLCNVAAASEELTPTRDDVVKNDDDDEWIVVEDES